MKKSIMGICFLSMDLTGSFVLGVLVLRIGLYFGSGDGTEVLHVELEEPVTEA